MTGLLDVGELAGEHCPSPAPNRRSMMEKVMRVYFQYGRPFEGVMSTRQGGRLGMDG